MVMLSVNRVRVIFRPAHAFRGEGRLSTHTIGPPYTGAFMFLTARASGSNSNVYIGSRTETRFHLGRPHGLSLAPTYSDHVRLCITNRMITALST